MPSATFACIISTSRCFHVAVIVVTPCFVLLAWRRVVIVDVFSVIVCLLLIDLHLMFILLNVEHFNCSETDDEIELC